MTATPRRLLAALGLSIGLALAAPAAAQDPGLVTRVSAHDVRTTIDRFVAAVREANWVVFTEIDHAAAAQSVGLVLRPRTVILFGNPRTGTGAMSAHPTLALDLPMRVLVWQDDAGRTQVTRSTGADLASRLFARHGVIVPLQAQLGTDAVLEGFIRKATD